MPANPRSEQELLARAYAMAGFTLAQLAATADIAVPADLRRDKGLGRSADRVAAGSWRRQQAGAGFPGSRHRTQDVPIDPSGQSRWKPPSSAWHRLIGVSGQPLGRVQHAQQALPRALDPGGRAAEDPHRRAPDRHAAAVESE